MFAPFKAHKTLLLKLLTLLAIGTLYMGRALNDFEEPFIEGDGLEYVLTTQAICDHLTPGIRVADVKDFKNRFTGHYKWDQISFKKEVVESFIAEMGLNQPYKGVLASLHCDGKGNWYAEHFCFYSIVNAPLYLISYNPVRSFIIMNAVFALITVVIILFYSSFSTPVSILAALSFSFSAAYWYLGWEHTEVFTMCLVASGLVLFFNKRKYLGMFIIALSALQNQPLALLAAFLGLLIVIDDRFRIKTLLKVFCIGLITVIPGLYYYLLFDSTNLIRDEGYLDVKYVTFNRVSGFFFDVNQGMILTIPLILLAYIIMIAAEYARMIRQKRVSDYTLFLPIPVILITCSVATMGNWNHGMAVINRYASWMSMIVMIHFFYLVSLQTARFFKYFIHYVFCSQVFTTLFHEQYNRYDWSSAANTHLAKWMYCNHEKLYNPDPVIFAGRMLVALNPSNSPIIYFHKRKPQKVLVYRDAIDSLVNLGIKKENVEKIKKNIRFNYGWGYVDMKYFKSEGENDAIYDILRQKRIEEMKNKIRNSKSWSEQVAEKAAIWGKTFEEVVAIDAEFMVRQDESYKELCE